MTKGFEFDKKLVMQGIIILFTVSRDKILHFKAIFWSIAAKQYFNFYSDELIIVPIKYKISSCNFNYIL